MKKYLLLFLMCVYASIGAWAEVTISSVTDNTVTLTITGEASDLANLSDLDTEKNLRKANTIVIVGALTSTGLSNLNEWTLYDQYENPNYTTKKLDFSNATIGGGVTSVNMGIEKIILPKNSTITDLSTINYGGSLNSQGSLQVVYVPNSDGTSVYIYLP